MYDKTSLSWLSGSVVKQGDCSSVFKIKLTAEDKKTLNGSAVLRLLDCHKRKIEYDVEVVDNVVMFTFPKALPIGDYIVEIEHAGYVFPSTDSILLTVNANLGNYINQVTELVSTKDYIKQCLVDNQITHIDLDELASKLNMTRYDDEPIKSQINSILEEINLLKQSVGQLSQYDDTALKKEITELSERLLDLKRQTYDDTALKERIATLETKQNNSDELKQRLEALEKNNLASTKRYGPTGYTLTFEGDDYIITFDNGARLIIGYLNAENNLGQLRGLTGIGKPHPFDGKSNTLAADPLPYAIMRTSVRSVQIATWESSNGIAVWYKEGIRVENPVRDSSKRDFSNAYYNRNDTNPISLANQPRLLEIYYQLGLFSESELERFGVVKK